MRTAEAALGPASAKEVVQLLQRLCAIYGTPPGWEDACRIYLDVLRQPAAVLAAAVRAHIEQSRWFPKPSELLEICAPLRWPLESELEGARADLEWVSDPVAFRTRAQLMAERRELYGEFTSDLDTEWMLWHLGTAPPVPDRATVAAARAELERLRQERQKVEREALRERLAAAMSHPQADELAYARAVLDRQLREEWAAKRVPAPAPPARSTPETALIEGGPPGASTAPAAAQEENPMTQSNRKFAGLETDYIKEGVNGGNERREPHAEPDHRRLRAGPISLSPRSR